MYGPSILLALLSAPLLAFADTPAIGTYSNPFNIPATGFSGSAGHSLNLSWTPTTPGTVSLILRSGASSDLTAGVIITSAIANSGSYIWAVPSDITRGTDYAIEIVDDGNTNNTNYTPYFYIDSSVATASSTSYLSQVTLGAPSSTLNANTATPTGSATSLTGSMASTSGTGSAASASTAASGSSSGAASQSTGASSASAAPATASGNSAPRATAMAGMMGLVALGALAL